MFVTVVGLLNRDEFRNVTVQILIISVLHYKIITIKGWLNITVVLGFGGI